MEKQTFWSLIPGVVFSWVIWTMPVHLVEAVLSFSGLVAMPLLFNLIDDSDRHGRHSRLFKLIRLTHPFFAAMMGFSFILEEYRTIFALLWFLYTLMLSLYGLVRVLQRGLRPVEELSIDAAFLYIPIGGFWFLMHHADLTVFGFSEMIVLLTAVHFHYASFAVPIFMGLLGRMPGKSRLVEKMIGLGIISPMLIAIGITFSPLLELVSTVMFSAVLMIYAWLLFRKVIPVTKNRIGKIGFGISSLSILVSMMLVLVYAAGEFTGNPWITIPDMVYLHGVTNAFLFTLGSALGWLIIRPEAKYKTGIPFSKLMGKGRIGADFFARNQMVAPLKRTGLVDRMADFKHSAFDPGNLPEAIRSFYEQTAKYELLVYPHWTFGFKTGARIFKRLSRKIEQINFPLENERLEEKMESYIISLDDRLDGREDVRAWVRIFTETHLPIYVAAYSTHSYQNQTYMNIAFPLPFGNMTSILRLYQDNRSLVLTSLTGDKKGDEGVYLVTPILPVRLPINETIQVWSAEDPAAPFKAIHPDVTIVAKHDMWLFGIRFLTLRYHIYPVKS